MKISTYLPLLQKTNLIFYSASPEPEPHALLPEFIEGSSSGVTHDPQPDIDNLAHKLYTTASFDAFDNEDNVWEQEGKDKWSF
jgi:hypothetical protein